MSKLDKLAEIEGYVDSFDMIQDYHIDSVVPGICKNKECDYSVSVEPDQRKGYCENCESGTVVSCLVLAEII